MNNILAIRKGGDVKRFHTETMLKENLVSSHSWGVAVLLHDIAPSCSKNLIMAALYHDVAEHITGDMSAVTKWRFPELKQALDKVEDIVNTELKTKVFLYEDEAQMLKFADMAELVLTCVREYQLGNQEAMQIVSRGMDYLEKNAWPEECRKYLPKIQSYVKETVK